MKRHSTYIVRLVIGFHSTHVTLLIHGRACSAVVITDVVVHSVQLLIDILNITILRSRIRPILSTSWHLTYYTKRSTSCFEYCVYSMIPIEV